MSFSLTYFTVYLFNSVLDINFWFCMPQFAVLEKNIHWQKKY